MRKLFSIIAVTLLAAAMLAGCSDGAPNTTVSNTSSAASDTESVAQSETADGKYADSFDGFVQYMTDNGFVSGDPVDTTASAIGAVQGKRFTMSSGTAKIYVELYEFPTSNLSDTASTTIENARNDGTFSIYNYTSATQNTVAAVTDDGRFLMLYTDSSTSEDNITNREEAVKAVKSFGK